VNLNTFDLKYKNAIDELANKQSSLSFNNSGPTHASIVISNIFKHTESIMRIYAKNMNGEISKIGDYLEQLQKFLESPKELRILIDELPYNKSKAFDLVTNDSKSNISIKFASDELRKEIAFWYNPGTHFITGDSKMFRLEYDSNGHQALCGFNNISQVKTLNRMFDKHFDYCIST